MRDRMVQLFGQLGIPEPVAIVYCALLARGPLTLRSLSHEPGVSRAVDPLTLLQKLQLVGRDRDRFYAAEPGLAWLAVIADLVWGKRAVLLSIESLLNFPDEDTERARAICAQIADVARTAYKPHLTVKRHREVDVEDSDLLAFLTCEMIGRAEREIVAMSKSPRAPQVSSFWAVLTDRILRFGIRYRRITDLDEVEAHGLKIVSRDMDDYRIDLRILERARIAREFYAVDGKLLAVSHQVTPDGHDRRGVGRITNYLDIVRRYRRRFERDSADGIPGRFVVQHLETVAEDMLSRAQRSIQGYMVSWLRDIIDYGKFSKFDVQEGWPRERTATVEQTLRAAGLVRRNAYGELVPNYGVTEEAVRRAYLSGQVPSPKGFPGTGGSGPA